MFMQTIKAAVCHEFGKPFKIEEIKIRAPQSGEGEVTGEACAICHSDINFADGGWPAPLPAVYGHEAAGRITAIGEGVKGLAVGDAVLATLVRSCGTCPSCNTAHPANCDAPGMAADGPLFTMDDQPIFHGLNTAAFAEKAVVDQSQIAKLPDGIPMDSAALISCGVITGVGAVVNTGQVRAGQDVVVIGAGGVGLNAIQGARIAGARRIIAVDLNIDKLEIAKEFGATHVVNGADKPWKAVKALTGRGADAVFVTVGVTQVYDTATRFLAPQGRIIMVGMPHTGATSSYEPLLVARMGQGMVGSYMGDVILSRDVPWIVDLYQQGRLKLDELISGRWSLEQINEAFDDTRSGAARRNVITFK
jgi:S-(hydroxymethyl)glutathione dehydrogenase/alcohol dehydrogenase